MSNDTDKGSSDNPDKPQDMSRDELEEALNWLENLASKQGKSLEGITPLEDGPAEESPFRGLFESDEGDLPDWLREMPSDPDSDEAGMDRASRLDWLARMASQESIEELPTLEWRQLSSYAEDINTDEESQVSTDDDLADLFDEPSPSQTATLSAPGLLVIAESAEEADTEPEVQLPEESVPTGLTDEEVVSPLISAQSSQADLVEPELEPTDPAPLSDVALPVNEEEVLVDQAVDQASPEVYPEPDDLDAAMAWLEELAASTDAPIEDLPSVADRALASKLMAEAVSGKEQRSDARGVASPDSPDPSLASSAEADVDEMSTGTAERSDVETVLAGAAFEAEVAAYSEPESGNAIQDPGPADDDTATTIPDVSELVAEDFLARLDRLAIPAGQSLDVIEARLAKLPSAFLISPYTLDSTLDWLAGSHTSAATSSSAASTADMLSADLVAAMPEDPDEALRWLESMAETEAAPERETRSSSSASSAMAVEVTEADLLDMPDDPDEAMAWIENLAAKSTKKE